MSKEPTFDLAAAHRYFSAECFNQAWELIDKTERTPAEDEQMLQRSFASAWHWSQRPDCTSENLSIAYWQISRIYALRNQPENARHYGQLCLRASQGEGIPPYCEGYAYEALARAEMAAGNIEQMNAHLQAAFKITEQMGDPEARQMLLDDLKTI